MDIRPVLTVVLVVVAAIGASMVLFPAFSALGGPPDVTTAETPALEPSVPAPYQGTKDDPLVVVQVGETGDGLPIQIWNDGPTDRAVAVELLHNDSNSSLFTRTETLPPNGTLRLELRAPASYLVEVTDESTGTTGTYPVTTEQFDCNARFAEVRIDGAGNVEPRTVATVVSC